MENGPGAVKYGRSFRVATADASSITSVVFIRPSAVTHSVNVEQRYVELTFKPRPKGLKIKAPIEPNLAPPGYYMLFILNDEGVPSRASFVRLES